MEPRAQLNQWRVSPPPRFYKKELDGADDIFVVFVWLLGPGAVHFPSHKAV